MKKKYLFLYFMCLCLACFAQTRDTVNLSLEQKLEPIKIQLYPNPASKYIFLKANSDIQLSYVEMYNVLGKKVKHQAIKASSIKTKIDISDLPNSIYMLKIVGKDLVITKRIIKK